MTPTAAYIPPVFQPVKEATELPDVLVNIISQYHSPEHEYDSALNPLTLDSSDALIDCEENNIIQDAIIGAMADPKCPRELLEQIFEHPVNKPFLNQFMKIAVAKGFKLNFDNTALNTPDFSELNLAGKFSAKYAWFNYPIFTNTNLDKADLHCLIVYEPKKEGTSVAGANLEGCNLLHA